MFIDELRIMVCAGDGGKGVVRWRHEKGIALGGPAGGDGGNGGDVYARAVRDMGLLARYRNQKSFTAERGEDGARDSLHGKNGEDLIIDVPVGSILTNDVTGRVISLEIDGQTELLLAGGKGGLGNEHFKSSTNRSPRQSTPGTKGECAEFFIELQLIADAGLVGFPNAGKSSLLNALTKANVKVGAYAFTTLEPNLGSFHGYILADIPGLIEGAGEGKGLGHKFLRHIKRTGMLVHLISLEESDIMAAYKVIRAELGAYSPDLLDKPEIILLTKTDMVDEKTLKERMKVAKKLSPHVFAVTLYDDGSIETFTKDLSHELARISKQRTDEGKEEA